MRFTRKLFGRGLNPVWLWLVDRFHLDQPVVYHVGRKSGREYATPLCVTPTPDGYIVPVAFGPDVDWLANLRATPHTRLTYGGVTHSVLAEVIDVEEAVRIAGGRPGCPCWEEYRVQEFVLLRPDSEIRSAQTPRKAGLATAGPVFVSSIGSLGMRSRTRPDWEVNPMRVLVAYASRHGATAGIADRIAAGLRESGIEADARPVREISDLASYDAFVVGSAAYMFHWLKEATAFVKRHGAVLAQGPTWLFSSGPLGTDLVDDKGQDVFEAARPKEFDELMETLHPRGEKVFFGALDPDAPPIGMAERMLRLMPASKEALPAGDFRDWTAIDAWASEIAADLKSSDRTLIV